MTLYKRRRALGLHLQWRHLRCRSDDNHLSHNRSVFCDLYKADTHLCGSWICFSPVYHWPVILGWPICHYYCFTTTTQPLPTYIKIADSFLKTNKDQTCIRSDHIQTSCIDHWKVKISVIIMVWIILTIYVSLFTLHYITWKFFNVA